MKKQFLFSILVASALFVGCSSETKEEAKEVANNTIDKVADVSNTTAKKASEVVEDVKKETTPLVDNIVEKSKSVVEDVKKEAAPLVENVMDKSKEVIEDSKEIVENVTKSAVDMTKNVQQKIHEATAPTPSVDGKALYTRCGSCHGQNGEKKALNSSSIIQGWSQDQVYKALKGYQEGTYGASMKGVMIGQVKNLKDDELQALATYISSL